MLTAVNQPKLAPDEIRAVFYVMFWEGETWLSWSAFLVFLIAIPVALWYGPWWWWALAGSALEGTRRLGCWFFRPVPQRKRRA